jgi:MFS family permease
MTLAAACVIFVQFGLFIGTWASHIPIVQARLGLDTASLGLALLGAGVGTIVSQPVAGILVGRVGSRPTTVAFAILSAVSLVLAVTSQTFAWFLAACAAIGVCWGGFNVSMNTQGNEIELARSRPTLSLLHAFVSLGMLSGAAIGALLIGMGWRNGEAAIVVAAVCVVFSLGAARYLLPSPPSTGAGGFTWPDRAVIGFGVLALLIFLVEGGMVDWSALFLAFEKGASEAVAPLGFFAYALAMAVVRLLGERLILAWGRRALVVGGAAIVACGLAVAALSPWLWLSVAAFAITGAATANIIPTLIASAAQTPGVQAPIAIGTVTTMMTFGLLVGPPIIGFVSHQLGLTSGIGLMAMAAVAVAILASTLRWANVTAS